MQSSATGHTHTVSYSGTSLLIRYQNKAYTLNSKLLLTALTLFLFSEFEFQNMNSQFCVGLFEMVMNQ